MDHPMAYRGIIARMKKNSVLLHAAREMAIDHKAYRVEEYQNVLEDDCVDFQAHFESKERADHFISEYKKLEKRPTPFARYTTPACR